MGQSFYRGRRCVCVRGYRTLVRYEWAKDGFGDLLMMALPHHMDTLDLDGGDSAVVMADSYQSIKVGQDDGHIQLQSCHTDERATWRTDAHDSTPIA